MPTAYYHAAPEAALGIVMALHAREQTGRGQLVDVSMQECQLSTLIAGPGQYALRGKLPRRSGARTGRTREIWATRDGHVSFGLRGGPARIPNLIATVEYMAECGMAPDWLRAYDWSRFNHNELTDAEIARFEAAFGAFFRSRAMNELYEQALRRRILLAPCNDAREVLEHRQLREREFFVTVEYPELGVSLEHADGFARSSASRIGIRRRAPRIGEHNVEIFDEVGIRRGELERLAAEAVV
jgi:crotonobetainyl-CoA:carnitine CoA-transferase CaiB-like acyl-CoA transferase